MCMAFQRMPCFFYVIPPPHIPIFYTQNPIQIRSKSHSEWVNKGNNSTISINIPQSWYANT